MHMCGGCERKLVSNLRWTSCSLTTFDPGTNQLGTSGSWKTVTKFTVHFFFLAVDSTKHSKREKEIVLFSNRSNVTLLDNIVIVFRLWWSHTTLFEKERWTLWKSSWISILPKSLLLKNLTFGLIIFWSFRRYTHKHTRYTQSQEVFPRSLSRHLLLLLGHNFLLFGEMG